MAFKNYKLKLSNITQGGKTCINPSVSVVSAGGVTIPCEYKNGEIIIQPLDDMESCVDVIIDCDDCDTCPPQVTRYCFCDTHDDCPDCTRCNGDGVCIDICQPGQICDGNKCVDCKADTDCPCNQICQSGKCICPSGLPNIDGSNCCVECANNNDCDICEICVGGDCQPKCPAGKCDPDTGDCVECLVKGDCGANECCVNGKCECCPGYYWDPHTESCVVEPICREDDDCPDCKVCDGGNCVDIVCPNGWECYKNECRKPCDCNDPICSQSEACVQEDNDNCYCKKCKGNCSENGDCGPGCYCRNGVCVPNPCKSNCSQGCEEGCGCDAGECVPCDSFSCDGNCEQIDGCRCRGGDCVDDPCSGPCVTGGDCGVGCGCSNGQCVSCSSIDCALEPSLCAQIDGCFCSGNNCVSDPCNAPCVNGNDCPDGCGCKDGSCVSCSRVDCANGDCDKTDGCLCSGNNCIADPCSGACDSYNDCPFGCTCVNGSCQSCASLSCSTNECADDPRCRCINGNCTGNPVDVYACKDNDYNSNGTCQEIWLLVDQSSNLDANRQADIEDAIEAFADTMADRPNHTLNILLFNTNGVTDLGAHTSGDSVSLTPAGCTNYTQAMTTALAEMDASSTSCEKTMILMVHSKQNSAVGGPACQGGIGTAGNPTAADQASIQVADDARAKGYNVIVFGYGPGAVGDDYTSTDNAGTLGRIANNDPNNVVVSGVDSIGEGFNCMTVTVGGTDDVCKGCAPAEPGDNPVFTTNTCDDNCEKYSCVFGEGCVQDPNGTLTKEQCAECDAAQWVCVTAGNECEIYDVTIHSSGLTKYNTQELCNAACPCTGSLDFGISHTCANQSADVTVTTTPITTGCTVTATDPNGVVITFDAATDGVGQATDTLEADVDYTISINCVGCIVEKPYTTECCEGTAVTIIDASYDSSTNNIILNYTPNTGDPTILVDGVEYTQGSGLSNGTYNITIISPEGCPSSNSVLLTVEDCSDYVVVFAATSLECDGGPSALFVDSIAPNPAAGTVYDYVIEYETIGGNQVITGTFTYPNNLSGGASPKVLIEPNVDTTLNNNGSNPYSVTFTNRTDGCVEGPYDWFWNCCSTNITISSGAGFDTKIIRPSNGAPVYKIEILDASRTVIATQTGVGENVAYVTPSLAVGNYTVRVTDSTGCVVEDSFTIIDVINSAVVSDICSLDDGLGEIIITMPQPLPAGARVSALKGGTAEEAFVIATGTFSDIPYKLTGLSDDSNYHVVFSNCTGCNGTVETGIDISCAGTLDCDPVTPSYLGAAPGASGGTDLIFLLSEPAGNYPVTSVDYSATRSSGGPITGSLAPQVDGTYAVNVPDPCDITGIDFTVVREGCSDETVPTETPPGAANDPWNSGAGCTDCGTLDLGSLSCSGDGAAVYFTVPIDLGSSGCSAPGISDVTINSITINGSAANIDNAFYAGGQVTIVPVQSLMCPTQSVVSISVSINVSNWNGCGCLATDLTKSFTGGAIPSCIGSC